MIKLVGSLCVLFAGGSVWWLQHQEQRRRRQVLAELAAALDYMETSIRLNRDAAAAAVPTGGAGPLPMRFPSCSREVRRRWQRGGPRKSSGVRQSPAFQCRKRTSGPCLNWSIPCKAMKRAPVKVYCLQEKSCKTACHNWKNSARRRKNARWPFAFPPPRCW